LPLQPHAGRRPTRAREGTVAAPASNRRWASGGFEVPCREGEVVRAAFAIGTHDRGVIAWAATAGAGIGGETARDMMLGCAERRCDAVRAPEPVRWLADDGPAHTAGETADFATAPDLAPCFTPARSPEGTDEIEQPLSASRANFLLRMGDRVAKSGAWR
jgi:transposase InsO family protein